MPAGRPPKPIEQKRRTGNPGGRALPAASSLAVVPPIDLATSELSPFAAMERVLSSGVSWIAESDAGVVAMLREALAERADLRAAVMAGHGKRGDLRELDKQILSMLSVLGFDPTARSRLGLAEVKAISKLEQLKQARAQG